MIPIGNFFFRHRNFLFPLVFGLMLFGPWVPITRDPHAQPWLLAVGLALALGGQALRAVTVGLAYIRRGGKNKQVYADSLVQEGIFAHCRNPLYAGNVGIVTGVGIASNSLPFLVLGVPFFLFAYLTIVTAEEHFLRGKFGPQFDDYCRRVNRFLPRLRGMGDTFRSMDFHWRRLLVKEYQTPYLWMVGFLFLLMVHLCCESGYAAAQRKLWLFASLAVVLTAGFLFAWFLKKKKIVRAD